MRTTTKKKRGSAGFWILLSSFLCGVAFLAISSWSPYLVQRHLERLEREMHSVAKSADCKSGDAACLKDQEDRVGELFTKIQEDNPIAQLKAMPEFRKAFRHKDETACYILQFPDRDFVDAELESWLERFGKKRFLDLFPYFIRMQDAFETYYHPPDWRTVAIRTASKLKWHYLPLGKTWRTINEAERFLEQELQSPAGRVADFPASEILTEVMRHSEYFTLKNQERLKALAKKE